MVNFEQVNTIWIIKKVNYAQSIALIFFIVNSEHKLICEDAFEVVCEMENERLFVVNKKNKV